MNYINILEGLVFLIGAFVYFRYFNNPLFDNKKEKKMRDEKLSENLIENIRLVDSTRDFKGWIGGIGLVIIGLILIYLGLTEK
jgi:hypothetical protein